MKQILAVFLAASMLAVVGCDEQTSTLSAVTAQETGVNKPAPIFETIFEAGTVKINQDVVSPSGELYHIEGLVDVVRGKRSDELFNYFATASELKVYNVDNLNEVYIVKESRREYYQEVADPTLVTVVHKLSVQLNLAVVYNITTQTELFSIELTNPSPFTDAALSN